VRRAALALALALAAAALTGCETTAEKSARLQRQAKRVVLSEKGLSIERESREVRVLEASVVRGSEGAAAVVVVRNASAHPLRAVPIAITVKNARGQTLFQNNGPGLEGALVSIPSLAPHQTLAWVDDQIPPNGEPTQVSARVGASPAATGRPPSLRIADARLGEDPSNGPVATGTLSNRSDVTQRNLVVFGLARRGGQIVAAGRGVLPELAAHGSSPLQVFFVGDPSGATLQLSAPATSFGR
jgi:hypothetical protein